MLLEPVQKTGALSSGLTVALRAGYNCFISITISIASHSGFQPLLYNSVTLKGLWSSYNSVPIHPKICEIPPKKK